MVCICRTLHNQLSEDLATTTSEQIKTALNLKSTQELCNSLGEKLDEANWRLHNQLLKYGSNLYDFEFVSPNDFTLNTTLTILFIRVLCLIL